MYLHPGGAFANKPEYGIARNPNEERSKSTRRTGLPSPVPQDSQATSQMNENGHIFYCN